MATGASLAALLVTALLGGLALWLQAIDEDPVLVRLLVAAAALTLVGFVATATAKLAEVRRRRVLFERRWHDDVGRLLAVYPNWQLPCLSELSDDEAFTTTAESLQQLPQLAELCRQISHRLHARWPDTQPLGPFPIFQPAP